jgi:hypothetical protein
VSSSSIGSEIKTSSIESRFTYALSNSRETYERIFDVNSSRIFARQSAKLVGTSEFIDPKAFQKRASGLEFIEGVIFDNINPIDGLGDEYPDLPYSSTRKTILKYISNSYKSYRI